MSLIATLSITVLSVMLSVETLYRYANCRYANCRYAECRYVECCGAAGTP